MQNHTDPFFCAVITARAGSVGLPGKNYKEINGKPLFMWSVEAALRSRYVTRVIVSSNDPEIERITKDFIQNHTVSRLTYSPRPEKYSGPLSKNEEALRYVIGKECKKRPDYMVLLQPTSPVRNNGLIDKCCETILKDPDYDCLFTASKHTPFFYKKHKCVKSAIDPSPFDLGLPIDHDPCRRPMRQELEEHDFFWHDNGNIYIFNPKLISKGKGCRIGPRPYIYESNFYQSWQIDNPHDFHVLESLSKEYGPFVDGI
jgi:CMP-N-acetylneuraminic acid synthetase